MKSDAKHSLRKTEVVPALGGQQRRDKTDWKRRETGRPFMLGPSKLISIVPLWHSQPRRGHPLTSSLKVPVGAATGW